MKKKVFSLMMTLLLAFIGVAKAEVVTIGEGTTTYYYYPVNMYFNFSLTEELYTPDEIGTAGTINAISFYYDYSSSFSMSNVTLYMKNVSRESFASSTDMEPLALGDIVWTGTFSATAAGWVTITLDTPFEYDGTSNLLVAAFDGTSGYPGSSFKFRTTPCTGYKGIHWYSDSYTPDPYNTASGFSGSMSYTQYRANIQLDITPEGGAGAGDQIFAVQDGEIVDTVYVGPRPNGYWMEPFTFQIRNTGAATRINQLDWTPEEYFTLVAPELPVQIARDEDIDVQLNTGESTNDIWQMVALYGNERTAAIWTIMAEPYDPQVPDVWEMAYDLGTVADGFSYAGIPSQITPTVLHNDYTLPFPEIPEGFDAVYKFTVDEDVDVMINAYVDPNAENGKVALYTEDFYGEGGPMATNNYQGPDAPGAGGSGSATGAFQAQIGEGTSTSGYFPFYCFYNYSLSQQLFLAAELQGAGVTSSPMNSLSWYCTASNGNMQSNITIWMANVDATSIGSSSTMTAGMTKVYTGNMTPVANQWNEFVFNQGTFAWDGHSNILISVQRNNGSWASGISWQVGAQSFTAGGYCYNDSYGAYNMETNSYLFGTNGSSYGGTTTNRANIIMRSGRSDRSGRELVTIAPGGTQQVAYPVNFIWAYTENQMILTADEIGTDGMITSVAYKRASEGSGNPETRNIDIYMAHTTMDAYGSTADWIPVTAADLVYSGNYTFQTVGEDWQTITLQTPFQYNGTDNLLICIDDNTGTTTTRQYWSCHTTPVARGMRAWGSSNFDPTAAGTPSGGSSLTGTFVADIQLNVEAAAQPGDHLYTAGPVITDLPLEPGTYYLVASATEPDYTVYINIDNMPCPAIDAPGFAFNPMPADDEDEVEPGRVTLRWMVPDYATAWRLIFGTTYYPDPNHPQTIMTDWDENMANSYTVTNLWNNTNYFWRVEFRNDACPEGVSSPVWGFTTHLNVPQNLTAVDYTVFDDEQIVLNWNAVVDRTYRMYNVYRDGVCIGHTTVNNIGNTTYTDGPLAYNMNGYTYYVTAVYDEGESAPSNEINVKVSGYGNVNGHVYEQDGTTGIAGATVTMVGQDEFGVNHTYNFQTNNQGYYSGHIYAGSYNGQAAKEGYQTIYEPIQGNPIDITYNETTSPIDYMLDENFDPVCTVIAEYYPDSLDPNSPYVKVYWGCGLPGEEIVEPFETGDFSLFDWQVDPTYPWTITTNNPYEGTYCMKSGGAGVANVISNMTVTVEIPADGIMSYFGKISCESNWDYGYFYLDGVQRAQYTGTSNWAEKSFEITAGTHTFQWRYTKDGSVNSNDDCFYVDYITFYKRPEPPQPAQPGWHTYAQGDFNNAVGSNVGTSRWAYEYPVSVIGAYAGFNLTKVSLFSDTQYSAVGGNYTCTIYQGGNEPMAGTAVSTITVDVPQNMNAWVDFDLTTPVSVSGSEKLWVVWTANTHLSNWPAGCCDGLVDEGTWWSAGIEAGYGWEHETYGTWTMRQYFTNREGRGFYSYASDNAPVAVEAPMVAQGAPVMPVKGQTVETTTCVNPNAVPGARVNTANRSLNHYRVYRTNCYNDGPYTEENTVLLATVWVPDTVYIDVEWADLAPGVYKWGVGAVYEGNRGELIEAPINWTAPQAVNRSATADNDPNPVPGEEGVRAPWDLITTFNAPEAAHYGVVTDGQYIYTSNWGYTSAAHNFYKYDMQGNMIEGFEITGCGTLRGMTFDGQHVYGVANSNTVYCVDLNSHTLVSTFTTTYGAMRGISYDPERNGFWVIGNWSGNLTLIDYNGAIQFTGPTPTSVSDLAYYKDENNVEHVFCFNNGDNGVYDYNITTNTLGGSVFNFSATPGFDAGSSGGCHVAEYNGKVAFFGDLQQDPNLIGIYELRDGGGTPGGGGGTTSNNLNQLALPRESETIWSNCLDKDMYLDANDVTVNVLLNSADSPEGVTVTFTNYNEAEQEMYPIDPVVLDETGFYAFESFRRGYYNVKVEFDGYEPIEDSVSIWEPTDLRYVMTEIIYGVSDLYVSSTGWAMWGSEGMPSNGQGGGGGQGGNGDTFSVNFDDGMPAGWTTIDGGSPQGYGWHLASATMGTGYGHNGSSDCVISQSYDNNYGVVYPDNYLVSPQVTLAAGSTFSFYACGQDANYAAEHFGVFVSDNGTSNWTMVNEWTIGQKGERYSGPRGQRDQSAWTLYSVDLSNFAGQKYVAIRHFNCSDMFYLDVDDIELSNGAKDGERHLEYFKVMCTSIDGEPIFNTDTEHPFAQVETESLVPGDHYICKVAAVYSTGMSSWSEVEWQYIPCENYAGTVNGVEVEGNTISWEYPGGGSGPTPPGQGDTFTVDFEAGMPAGWTTIDGGSPQGYGWQLISTKIGTGYGHNGSSDGVLSQSYDNNYGVVYPDNYLVSPQVTLAAGSTFSFYACAQDANYAAEHFGVFVSDNGTSNWTMVNEWTIGQKGERYSGPRGQRDQSAWTLYSVDLSNFAGQKYVAIRHFNCSDQFYLDVDDIELSNGAKGDRAAWEFFNGYVTDPGAMANGADASWTKGSQGTWGPNANYSAGSGTYYWLADSFTVDAATTISEIEVYGYQTGSSTTSTFTGLYAQIYNGAPNAGGTAIWGNTTSNIMTATAFTNCYRGSDGETTATTRPIMSITAGGLDIQLEAGTYYLVYALTGTSSSGPWGAPHAEPSIGNTGNGLQCTSSGWTALSDSGSGTAYGCAMKLTGTTGGGQGPTPTGDLLGAMIFADGEWEAFVEYPTNEYVYEGEAEEVCVRMVYNGTNNLPEGNIYFSMSCPECVDWTPGQVTCEAGAPIHSELVDANHIKVWWGEEPAAPVAEWLYYDDGTYATSVGAGGTLYWGTMFPAASLAPYAGTSLTKVAVHTSYACSATLNVYVGGAQPGGSPAATQTFTMAGDQEFMEIVLNNPVAVDGTQNLWITFYQSGVTYPADACSDTGDANNRWVSIDGASWMDLAEAGLPGYGWMIRGFVTNQAKGGIVSLPEFKGNVGGQLSHNAVVSKPADLSFMNRASLVKYNVYRSTEANGAYILIGEVTEETAPNYYEYIDSPTEAGTYYYQVRAYYDNDCESDPALAADGSGHDYVSETTTATGVEEIDGNVALYPNPTSGNVTIEAQGMTRITVVSVLGQVVYDVELNADVYTMNMAQFNAGMYMVRVYTENGVSVKRVTVMQ